MRISTKENIKDSLPLIISLSLFLIIVSIIIFISTNLTNGNFVYALDDAYIHLAYAKNIAVHGIFGITKYEYSSPSSSPMWTMILTISIMLFGVSQYIPFILNMFFSAFLLYVIFKFLKEYEVSNFLAGFTLIVIVIFLPLSIHVFSGMEHILHAIVTILFVKYSAEALSQEHGKNEILSQSEKHLLLLSFLITTVRYEGFFLIMTVSVLFLVRRRYLVSILIMIVSIVLPTIYGIISMQNGGSFLPNSILLKGINTASSNFLLGGEYIFNYHPESKKNNFPFSDFGYIIFSPD